MYKEKEALIIYSESVKIYNVAASHQKFQGGMERERRYSKKGETSIHIYVYMDMCLVKWWN